MEMAAKKYKIRRIARIWAETHQWRESTFYGHLAAWCHYRAKDKPYRLSFRDAQKAISSVRSSNKWTGTPYPSLAHIYCKECGKEIDDLEYLCSECLESNPAYAPYTSTR